MAQPAETAYLFRHALLRDAAYLLHLPADRARLHSFAFGIIEQLHGGRPPEPAGLDADPPSPFQPHATDAVALELAMHASEIRDSTGPVHWRRLYRRRAAEHAERSFDLRAAAASWQALAGLIEGVEKGEALRRAGFALVRAGDNRGAEPLFAQALEAVAGASSRRAEAEILTGMATLYRNTGRTEMAKDSCLRSLAIQDAAQDALRRANTLLLLALLDQDRGNTAQAEDGYMHALAIFRQLGHRRGEGSALANLAVLQHRTGRIDSGRQTYEQALQITREIGDRFLEAAIMTNVALMEQDTGRLDKAEALYVQALAMQREVGNRRDEGNTLGNLASLYNSTGRQAEAESLFGQALAIHREVANLRDEGIALSNLAQLYEGTGRLMQSEQAHERALQIHLAVGNRRSYGVALGARARLHSRAGRADQAESDLRRAIEIHREVGNQRHLCIHLNQLGSLCSSGGRLDAAEISYQEAASVARGLGDIGAEAYARAGLAGTLRRAGLLHRAEESLQHVLGTLDTITNREARALVMLEHALLLVNAARRPEAVGFWGAGIELLLADKSEVMKARVEMRATCQAAGVRPLEEGSP